MNHEHFDNDDLLKKIISKDKLEQPSFDFTNKVMAKIQSPESAAVFSYQPVISRKAWIVTGAVGCSLILFLMFIPSTGGNSVYDISGYLTPAQHFFTSLSSGFMQKISVLNSLSVIAVITSAGWMLLAADKLFSKSVLSR